MALKTLSNILPLPPPQWERIRVTLPKLPKFEDLPKIALRPSLMPTPALLAITGLVALIASTVFIYIKILNFDEYSMPDLSPIDIMDGSSLNSAVKAHRSEEEKELEAKKTIQSMTKAFLAGRLAREELKDLEEKKKAAIVMQSAIRGFLAKKTLKELKNLEEERKFNTEINDFFPVPDGNGDVSSSQINGFFPKTIGTSPSEIEEKRFEIYLILLERKHPEIKKLIPKKGTSQEKFNAVLSKIRAKPKKYSKFCKTLFTDIHIYTFAEQLITIVAKRRFIVTNSLTRNLLSQFGPIDSAASAFSTGASAWGATRRLGAHTNLYFNPIAEGNLPCVLDTQTYQNGTSEFQTTCIRTSCPVDQSPITNGFSVPRINVNIAPEYKQFVETLDGPLGYFSLQTDTDKKPDWNGGERLRINPFRVLEKSHSNFFYFFSLSMDEEAFKCEKPFSDPNIAAYKKTLIDAMMHDRFGFYFPHQLDKTELEKDLNGLFDKVISLFFPKHTEFKDIQEKQIFLILFYACIELFYTTKLKLRYKHFSCKDGVDRAGILNIVAMRLQQFMLGKEEEYYPSRQLQTFTHLPAFTSRHTSILPQRRCHLVAVLDFLDNMPEEQKAALHGLEINGYRLTDLSIPKDDKDDDLILFLPDQAKTLPEYIRALLLDPKTHNPFIRHTFDDLKMEEQDVDKQLGLDFPRHFISINGLKMKSEDQLRERVKRDPTILAYCTQTAIPKALEPLSLWYLNADLNIYVREQKGIPPKFELTLTEEKKVMRITKTFYLCHTPDTNPEGTDIAKTVLLIDVDFNRQTYTAQFKTELLVDPQYYFKM